MLAALREGASQLAGLLAPLGLTPAQAEVLTVLDRAGSPLSVREIGDLLVCERSSPSRLVNAMVDYGLLQLRKDGADARVSLVSLTRTGRQRAKDVAEAEQQLHSALRSSVGRADLAGAVRALRGIVAGTPSGDALERRAEQP